MVRALQPFSIATCLVIQLRQHGIAVCVLGPHGIPHAWNKANIRIQEMERGGHFVADVWKRFVVDEKIDCCVKYGFTSKRRFGTALKVQELENITVREESRDRRKSCEQLRRKVVCDIKATFTTRDEEVEPDAGILRYIPHDDLVSFLTHPIIAAVYLRDWCIPFYRTTQFRSAWI